jgi:hypothetical protein
MGHGRADTGRLQFLAANGSWSPVGLMLQLIAVCNSHDHQDLLFNLHMLICWSVLVAPMAEARAWVGIGSGRTRWRGGGRLAGRGPGRGKGGRRPVKRGSRARGPGTRTPDSLGPPARTFVARGRNGSQAVT